jgi:hypothetical protein
VEASSAANFSEPVALGEGDFSQLDDTLPTMTNLQQKGGGMNMSGMNMSGMNQSGMNQSGMNQSGMNQSGSVNVQTSTQPVLVIPMNVGKPPAATQMIQPPINGAPSTISVDTSQNAIQNTIEQTNGTRPKSRRGSNVSFGGAAAAANTIVNVIKQG